MTILNRRCFVVTAVSLAAAVGALTVPGAAQAQPVESGVFAMSGDPGDYITGGDSYRYEVSAGDQLTVSGSANNRSLSVSINGKNGDWWSLDLAAPLGKKLTAGDYPEATRYPFNDAGAGLSVSGNGRGCNELTGSFVINSVSFGPNGYVENLDAAFEQHCEGGDAALRGTVKIDNPPAPAELVLGLATATDGTFSKLNGKATVHGTVSCSSDVAVRVSGNITQVKKKIIIRGSFAATVPCTKGADAAWSATATPTGTTPFQKGKVEVETTASATDPVYDNQVTESAITTVELTRAAAA